MKTLKPSKAKNEDPATDARCEVRANDDGSELEVIIYDVIGDYWGEGVTAKDVLGEISKFPEAERINVHVNSPGGSAFDGIAIYNALAQHAAEVVVTVDGAALSAASIISMAGDRILMAENAMMMIHEAWIFSGGTATELRKDADWLAKLDEQIATTYARRTGRTVADVQDMMSETTWMTAEEAVEAGFADEVIEGKQAAACPRIDEMLAKCKNKIPPRVAAALARFTVNSEPTSGGIVPPPTATANTQENIMAEKDPKDAAGDVTPTVPANTPDPTATPAAPDLKKLMEPYIATFGPERGAKYAADGKTMDEAQAAYNAELKAENEELREKLDGEKLKTDAAVAASGADEPAGSKPAPEEGAIVVPNGVVGTSAMIYRAMEHTKATGAKRQLQIIPRPASLRTPGRPMLADSNWSMADMALSADENLEGFTISDLIQVVPLLAALPFNTTDGTTYKYPKETGAPTVGFREVNTGRELSKSSDTIVTANLALLDASHQQDKALADQWVSGSSAWMAREGGRHLRAALFVLEQQIIYGATSPGSADGFSGFLQTLSSLAHAMVISAGGTTPSIQSSCYILNAPFDFRGIHVVFGLEGRINIGDVVEQMVTDASSKHFTALTQSIIGWTTVAVGGIYSMARIANINGPTDSNPLTDTLIGQAVELFPIGKRQNLMIVINRRTRNGLRASRTATSATGNPAPTPTEWEGIPIITVESLTETEAVET